MKRVLKKTERIGDPCRIRTCDHLLRRQVLYPAELRGLKPSRKLFAAANTCLKPPSNSMGSGFNKRLFQCVQGWMRE